MTDRQAHSPVTIERTGTTGIVTLSRPEKRNALDLTMRAAIADAFRELSGDEMIKAIIVTGGDKVFAAGADLNLLVNKGPREVADLELGQYWAPVITCPKPVIAAVSGYALGAGCELVMMCDIVITDSGGVFGQPECNVGIMPGAGGTQRLVRTVGRPVASLLLMTGELLSAERAYQLGFVSELVEEGRTLERAKQLAKKISHMPPKAIQAIKRVLDQGAGLPLREALALENREFLLLFDTSDKTEGMRAFLEKRKPLYRGN